MLECAMDVLICRRGNRTISIAPAGESTSQLLHREHQMAPQHRRLTRRERLILTGAALRGFVAGATRVALDRLIDCVIGN
jgi:hypothetical protein